jgi:hypothetical protein
MRTSLVRFIFCACFSLFIVSCGTFTIESPKPNTSPQSPVATNITWSAELQPNTLRITVDNNDVTNSFAISGQSATASLPLQAGTHSLTVSGSLWSWYQNSYVATSTGPDNFMAYPGNESVVCNVFDDGLANEQGPSDAIFVSGSQNGKSCIPDNTAQGTCRKWFGDCRTAVTSKRVFFYVFDDGARPMSGPNTAVYFPSGGKQACIPDNTSHGTCHKWFGNAYTEDGRVVKCSVFDDNYANITSATNAVYIPSPLAANGEACIPDNTAQGTCRKWFGRCSAVTGSAVTYTETILATGGGLPSGQIGQLRFGKNSSHPDVNLVFQFDGNTSNVIPFYVPTDAHHHQIGINDGWGNMITVGSSSISVVDSASNQLIIKANFLPAAGIFISVDEGNSGIGFGSHAALPHESTFPNKGLEVAYPYALSTASPRANTDLLSNFSYTNSQQNSFTVQGFSGSPGNGPFPLQTDMGDLIIFPEVQNDVTPAATFTTVVH